MIADDFCVRDAFPARLADEVLGFEQRVAEHGGRGYHGDEVRGGHGFPEFVEEGAVVDAQGGGDAAGETGPVFGVVAVGPFVEAGVQAQRIYVH